MINQICIVCRVHFSSSQFVPIRDISFANWAIIYSSNFFVLNNTAVVELVVTAGEGHSSSTRTIKLFGKTILLRWIAFFEFCQRLHVHREYIYADLAFTFFYVVVYSVVICADALELFESGLMGYHFSFWTRQLLQDPKHVADCLTLHTHICMHSHCFILGFLLVKLAAQILHVHFFFIVQTDLCHVFTLPNFDLFLQFRGTFLNLAHFLTNLFNLLNLFSDKQIFFIDFTLGICTNLDQFAINIFQICNHGTLLSDLLFSLDFDAIFNVVLQKFILDTNFGTKLLNSLVYFRFLILQSIDHHALLLDFLGSLHFHFFVLVAFKFLF